jgi:hypothetical protein
MYAHCGYALLWSIQPLPLLSLTTLPPTCNFQQLSIHILISSTFTSYVMQHYWFFDRIHPLYYSFLSPFLTSTSILQFLVGFNYAIACIHKMYFNHIHSLSPTPFPLPLASSTTLLLIFMYYYYYYLGLNSAYEGKLMIFVFLSWLISLNIMDLKDHAMQPKLASNLWSSCPSFPNAGITGISHQILLIFLSFWMIKQFSWPSLRDWRGNDCS